MARIARTKKTEKKDTFSPKRRISVSVGRTVQLREYEPVRMSFSVEENIPDGKDYQEAITETFDELTEVLKDKLIEYFEKIADEEPSANPDEEERTVGDETEPDTDSEPDENGNESKEEEVITENDIWEMSKKDLIQLIEEEDLDIETKGKTVKKLRQEVVDLVFEDEDNWGDE